MNTTVSDLQVRPASFPRWISLAASLSLGLGLTLLLLAGVGMFNPIRWAQAAPAVITVTTTTDELNSDGDCSLREAIQAANTDAAVDACPAGSGADTVIIPAGTYTLTIAGQDEDLNAAGDLDITDTVTLDGVDMATTIINANNIDRALHASTTTVTLTLLNLTIRNGQASGTPDSGGGLYAAGPAVVSNTTFLNNLTYNRYGGGAHFNSSATVSGTTFIGNTANNYYGGGASFYGAATVTDTTFISNTADRGGGAYFFGAATVTSTTFISNTATGNSLGEGGGAYFSGAATVTGTIFLSNTTRTGGGGGAFFFGAATVAGATFISNTASGGGGGAYFSGAATVMSTTFTSNTANLTGGNSGGASFNSVATVMGTTFINNTADKGGGASFVVGPVMVTDTIFTGNKAIVGGGVYLYILGMATDDFVNVLFASNHAQTNQGSALYAANYGGNNIVALRHVTIASPTVGSGSAVYMLAGTLNLTNTIIASYTVGLERAGGVLNENYNLFSGVATPYSGTIISGGNSLTGTVAFTDTTLYKLSDASAAIDTGMDVGIATDFEGELRPAGAGYDIGWDENAPPDIPISGLSATNDSPHQVVHAIAFTATISAGTGVSYQWNFGDNSPISTLPSPTHFYAVPGYYTATVTAINSLGSLSVSTPVTITEAAFKVYLPLIAR